MKFKAGIDAAAGMIMSIGSNTAPWHARALASTLYRPLQNPCHDLVCLMHHGVVCSSYHVALLALLALNTTAHPST